MEYEFIEHLGGMDIRLFAVSINKRQTHFHSDIELLVCMEGSVYIDMANMRTLVRQGDIFLINSNEMHSLFHTDKPNALLVLQFSLNFSDAYYPKFSRIRITDRHITKKGMPQLYTHLMRCFGDIVNYIGQKMEGYQLALSSSLNFAAFSIIQYATYYEHTKGDLVSAERKRVRLTGIIDYIQKNYMHPITLSEIAQREGLDMTYISHFIKEQLGISFREYVNRLRREKAANLIMNSDMRMIDVCVECGYSDYRYLNKAFLAEFGCTPSQFKDSGVQINPSFLQDHWEKSGEHSILDINAAYENLITYFTIDAI